MGPADSLLTVGRGRGRGMLTRHLKKIIGFLFLSKNEKSGKKRYYLANPRDFHNCCKNNQKHLTPKIPLRPNITSLFNPNH